MTNKDEYYIFEGGARKMDTEKFWPNAKEVSKEQRAKQLTDLIEWHFGNIRAMPTDSRTYKEGAKKIRQYAEEYKEVTGKFYMRDWK